MERGKIPLFTSCGYTPREVFQRSKDPLLVSVSMYATCSISPDIVVYAVYPIYTPLHGVYKGISSIPWYNRMYVICTRGVVVHTTCHVVMASTSCVAPSTTHAPTEDIVVYAIIPHIYTLHGVYRGYMYIHPVCYVGWYLHNSTISWCASATDNMSCCLCDSISCGVV